MSELTGGCLVTSFIQGSLAVRCNNYFVKKNNLFIYILSWFECANNFNIFLNKKYFKK